MGIRLVDPLEEFEFKPLGLRPRDYIDDASDSARTVDRPCADFVRSGAFNGGGGNGVEIDRGIRAGVLEGI